MSLAIKEISDGKVVEATLTGKLVKQDYAPFVPVVDRLVERHGKIRMLVEMHDFHGWTAGGMWEDTKFTLHHFHAFERLAIIGEKKWQHGMAVFCKPFTTGKVRYFDQSATNQARAWLGEN